MLNVHWLTCAPAHIVLEIDQAGVKRLTVAFRPILRAWAVAWFDTVHSVWIYQRDGFKVDPGI
jgi:hypothetical protein